MKKPQHTTKTRTIKSFVLRQGRMTERQKSALEKHRERYLLHSSGPLELRENTYLEIGFGMGDSLWQTAKAHPDNYYIGVEVHKPGVGSLLDMCASHEIANVAIYNEDVNTVLEKVIPDASLAGILIFFPDPWPKKKHHKRRLIQAPFVSKLIAKLKPGGIIHLATDWEDYAQQMMKVLSSFEVLGNQFGANCFADDVQRPLTKFERRGKRLGHGVWDLVFVKNKL